VQKASVDKVRLPSGVTRRQGNRTNANVVDD
jgi:hypothetical protein